MYSIAICDDDSRFAELMCKRINNYFCNTSSSVTIQIFTDPQMLLKTSIKYDLYILDIRMPQITGLEIAKSIRNESDTLKSSIIFISSINDAVFDSIKFSPLRYIRKELLDHELPEALSAFLSLKNKQEPDTIIVIKENRQTISIKISDISLVEAFGHYVAFKCKNKTHHTRAKLSDFETLLQDNSFSCARRGCFINLAHIHLLTKQSAILINGEEIPLSRSCQKKFQNSYLKWEREHHHVFTI